MGKNMVTKLSLSMVSVSDDTGAVFPRENAKALALAIGRAKTVRECQKLIKNAIEGLPTSGEGSSWFQTGSRLIKWLNRPTRNRLPFAVFARGNGKLPFYAFSALPFATCPGMGACEHFCYSPRSWRVAPPFFRQIQNTILARFYPGIIATRFFALPDGVVLRLFVDGDFHDTGAIRFWMGALKIRPDIRAYGYSKSWDQFSEYQRQGGVFPGNYVFNLSSGGREQDTSADTMRALVSDSGHPVARGAFVAVPIDPKLLRGGNKRYQKRAYHDAVRESARALGYSKVFSCPGKCGECIKGADGRGYSHACGDRRFQGVVIANGVH